MDEISRKKALDITTTFLDLAPTISKVITDAYKKKTIISNFDVGVDIVTNLDHEVGKLVIDSILKKYDDVQIDSEEEAERIGEGKFVLRIDPVDGSKHFRAGIPIVSSIASLSFLGQVISSVVINPFTGDTFYAFTEKGAFLNGKQVYAKNLPIEKSILFVETPTIDLFIQNPANFSHNQQYFEGLSKKSFRIRNVGNAGIAISLVAGGSVSAFVDLSGTTKLYDVEGPLFIARESGCVCGNTKGDLIDGNFGNLEGSKKYLTENVIIAHPDVYRQIVGLLSKL